MNTFFKITKSFSFVFLLLSSHIVSAEDWNIITELFEIEESRPVFDRINRQHAVSLKITNKTGLSINSDLRLVFENSSRSLANPDGTDTLGRSYKLLELSNDVTFDNNESITIVAKFPLARGAINFDLLIEKSSVPEVSLESGGFQSVADSLLSSNPIVLHSNDGTPVLIAKIVDEENEEIFAFSDKTSVSIVETNVDGIREARTTFELDEGILEFEYIVEQSTLFDNIASVVAEDIKFEISDNNEGYTLFIPKALLEFWSSNNGRFLFDGKEIVPTIIEDDPILFFSRNGLNRDADSDAYTNGYLSLHDIDEDDPRCLEYHDGGSYSTRFCKVVDLENAYAIVYTHDQIEDPSNDLYDDLASVFSDINTLAQLSVRGLMSATVWKAYLLEKIVFDFVLSKTNLYMMADDNLDNILNSPNLVYGSDYQPLIIITTGNYVGQQYNLSLEVTEAIQENSSAFAIYNSNPGGAVGRYRIRAKRTVFILPKTLLNVETASTASVVQFTTSVNGGSLRGTKSRTQIASFNIPPIGGEDMADEYRFVFDHQYDGISYKRLSHGIGCEGAPTLDFGEGWRYQVFDRRNSSISDKFSFSSPFGLTTGVTITATRTLLNGSIRSSGTYYVKLTDINGNFCVSDDGRAFIGLSTEDYSSFKRVTGRIEEIYY